MGAFVFKDGAFKSVSVFILKDGEFKPVSRGVVKQGGIFKDIVIGEISFEFIPKIASPLFDNCTIDLVTANMITNEACGYGVAYDMGSKSIVLLDREGNILRSRAVSLQDLYYIPLQKYFIVDDYIFDINGTHISRPVDTSYSFIYKQEDQIYIVDRQNKEVWCYTEDSWQRHSFLFISENKYQILDTGTNVRVDDLNYNKRYLPQDISLAFLSDNRVIRQRCQLDDTFVICNSSPVMYDRNEDPITTVYVYDLDKFLKFTLDFTPVMDSEQSWCVSHAGSSYYLLLTDSEDNKKYFIKIMSNVTKIEVSNDIRFVGVLGDNSQIIVYDHSQKMFYKSEFEDLSLVQTLFNGYTFLYCLYHSTDKFFILALKGQKLYMLYFKDIDGSLSYDYRELYTLSDTIASDFHYSVYKHFNHRDSSYDLLFSVLLDYKNSSNHLCNDDISIAINSDDYTSVKVINSFYINTRDNFLLAEDSTTSNQLYVIYGDEIVFRAHYNFEDIVYYKNADKSLIAFQNLNQQNEIESFNVYTDDGDAIVTVIDTDDRMYSNSKIGPNFYAEGSRLAMLEFDENNNAIFNCINLSNMQLVNLFSLQWDYHSYSVHVHLPPLHSQFVNPQFVNNVPIDQLLNFTSVPSKYNHEMILLPFLSNSSTKRGLLVDTNSDIIELSLPEYHYCDSLSYKYDGIYSSYYASDTCDFFLTQTNDCNFSFEHLTIKYKTPKYNVYVDNYYKILIENIETNEIQMIDTNYDTKILTPKDIEDFEYMTHNDAIACVSETNASIAAWTGNLLTESFCTDKSFSFRLYTNLVDSAQLILANADGWFFVPKPSIMPEENTSYEIESNESNFLIYPIPHGFAIYSDNDWQFRTDSNITENTSFIKLVYHNKGFISLFDTDNHKLYYYNMADSSFSVYNQDIYNVYFNTLTFNVDGFVTLVSFDSDNHIRRLTIIKDDNNVMHVTCNSMQNDTDILENVNDFYFSLYDESSKSLCTYNWEFNGIANKNIDLSVYEKQETRLNYTLYKSLDPAYDKRYVIVSANGHIFLHDFEEIVDNVYPFVYGELNDISNSFLGFYEAIYDDSRDLYQILRVTVFDYEGTVQHISTFPEDFYAQADELSFYYIVFYMTLCIVTKTALITRSLESDPVYENNKAVKIEYISEAYNSSPITYTGLPNLYDTNIPYDLILNPTHELHIVRDASQKYYFMLSTDDLRELPFDTVVDIDVINKSLNLVYAQNDTTHEACWYFIVYDSTRDEVLIQNVVNSNHTCLFRNDVQYKICNNNKLLFLFSYGFIMADLTDNPIHYYCSNIIGELNVSIASEILDNDFSYLTYNLYGLMSTPIFLIQPFSNKVYKIKYLSGHLQQNYLLTETETEFITVSRKLLCTQKDLNNITTTAIHLLQDYIDYVVIYNKRDTSKTCIATSELWIIQDTTNTQVYKLPEHYYTNEDKVSFVVLNNECTIVAKIGTLADGVLFLEDPSRNRCINGLSNNIVDVTESSVTLTSDKSLLRISYDSVNDQLNVDSTTFSSHIYIDATVCFNGDYYYVGRYYTEDNYNLVFITVSDLSIATSLSYSHVYNVRVYENFVIVAIGEDLPHEINVFTNVNNPINLTLSDVSEYHDFIFNNNCYITTYSGYSITGYYCIEPDGTLHTVDMTSEQIGYSVRIKDNKFVYNNYLYTLNPSSYTKEQFVGDYDIIRLV